MILKAISTALLMLGLQLLAVGCSPEARELWADDLAEMTGGQVAVSAAMPKAVASKTGLQAQQGQTKAEAFTMAGGSALTDHQLLSVLYLQWPQSHEAIAGLLGTPGYRDDQADYFTMPNGHTLTVYYAGGEAIGYTLGDSGE
ncbi:MAG: hypothetical protein AAFW84_21305 [Cyanobacteria bacterium J06635_15]